MTPINNYQCHYTLIKKMMTSKPEDRLRKNGVKTRKYYKWLRWSMKNFFICRKIPRVIRVVKESSLER